MKWSNIFTFEHNILPITGGYFMYTYAFVGYLDRETEVNFRGLWKDLSEQNISHYGVETKGKRPHITIADYDALDKNRIVVISPDRTYFSMFYALGLSYKLKDWNIFFRFNESITSDENLTDLILAKNMYYRSFDLGFQFRVF